MKGAVPPGRVLAALVGVALLAAGCGRGGGSPGASRPAVHQELVAFAHCMRAHGVPDWPDPLPQGGFPATGSGGNSPQAGSAMHTCRHLLPPIQPISAAQQARVLAHDLKWTRCMRAHGFAVSDPSVRPHAGVVIMAPPGFDPTSPQAQAAAKACQGLEGPVTIAQGGGS